MGARGAAVAVEIGTETEGIEARVGSETIQYTMLAFWLVFHGCLLSGRQAEIGTTVTGGAATAGVVAPLAQISSPTRRCPGTLRRKWSSR